MDLAAIETFISSVGFPIAAYILMWYSHHKTQEKIQDELAELKAQHD